VFETTSVSIILVYQTLSHSNMPSDYYMMI